MAKVQIWDGASTNGREKFNLNLAAGETVQLDSLHRVFEYGDVVAQTDSATVEVSGSGKEL